MTRRRGEGLVCSRRRVPVSLPGATRSVEAGAFELVCRQPYGSSRRDHAREYGGVQHLCDAFQPVYETRSGPTGVGIGIDNVDALLLDRWEGRPGFSLGQ